MTIPSATTNEMRQALSHLNDDQRRAVTHDPANGALLVVAGPGSGKIGLELTIDAVGRQSCVKP